MTAYQVEKVHCGTTGAIAALENNAEAPTMSELNAIILRSFHCVIPEHRMETIRCDSKSLGPHS